jgi:peroxiredoxin
MSGIKRIAVVGLALICWVAVGCSQAADSNNPWVGKQAPDFTLTELDGKEVSLADYRGKVVVVAFWGVGCGGCRAEAPHLAKLYKKYKDRGFEVLGVHVWNPFESSDDVRKFVETFDISYPVLLEGAEVCAVRYETEEIPRLFWIDRNGKIVATKNGFEPGDEAKLDRITRKLF